MGLSFLVPRGVNREGEWEKKGGDVIEKGWKRQEGMPKVARLVLGLKKSPPAASPTVWSACPGGKLQVWEYFHYCNT